MALPYDALFAAGFAVAGHRALGSWLRFGGARAEHRRDAGFFASLDEMLDEDEGAGTGGGGDGAGSGGGRRARRARCPMGAGAAASGQGHLWAEWRRLRPSQRADLLGEMAGVLRLTGQDAGWRHLRAACGRPWRQLSNAQRAELVWAADALDWRFVERAVADAAAPPAGPALWQVTEPLPVLSEEPLRAREAARCAEELRAAAAAKEPAIARALRAGAAAAAAQLAPARALGAGAGAAAERVAELKGLLQGSLGLGAGGRAERCAELLELARGIELRPASGVVEQVRQAVLDELEAEVERGVAAEREAAARAERAAEHAGRTAAVEAALRAGAAGAARTPAAAAALLALGCEALGERLEVAGFISASTSGLAGRSSPLTPGSQQQQQVRASPGRGGSGSGGRTIEPEVGAIVALMGELLDGVATAYVNGGVAPPPAVEEAARMVARLQREVDGVARAQREAAETQQPQKQWQQQQQQQQSNNSSQQQHPPAAAAAAVGSGTVTSPVRAFAKAMPSPRDRAPGTLLSPCLIGLQALAYEVARLQPPPVPPLPAGNSNRQANGFGSSTGSSGGGHQLANGLLPDGRAEMERLLAQLRFEAAGAIAAGAAAAATAARAALETARREARARAVARRGRALAAAARDPDTLAAEGLSPARPSAPVQRLAYGELYLRQLAASLPPDEALPAVAAFTAAARDAATGGGGLGAGVALAPRSAAAAAAAERLLAEVAVADAALRLELGPEAPAALAAIGRFLDGLAERALGEAEAEAGAAQAGAAGAAASTPDRSSSSDRGRPLYYALSPDLEEQSRREERAAAARCRTLVAELRADGIVGLGLGAEHCAALQELRAAAEAVVAAALGGAGSAAGAYEAAIAALRSAAARLPAVAGAAARAAPPEGAPMAARAAAVAAKRALVEAFDRARAVLAFEDAARRPALAAVRGLKVCAEAAGIFSAGSRDSVLLALDKAAEAEAHVAALHDAVGRLPPPPRPTPAPSPGASPRRQPPRLSPGRASALHAAAVGGAADAVGALAEAAEELRARLAGYLALVELRQQALRGAVAVPPPPPARRQQQQQQTGKGADDGDGGSGGNGAAAAAVAAEGELLVPTPSLDELAADRERAGCAFCTGARGHHRANLFLCGSAACSCSHTLLMTIAFFAVSPPTVPQTVNAPLVRLADASAADERTGALAVARGEVAVVILATGTVPEGAEAPAGAPRVTQPVPGLPSGRSALQLFCERAAAAQVAAARRCHGDGAAVAAPLHVCVVASAATHGEVRGGRDAVLWACLQCDCPLGCVVQAHPCLANLS